MPAVNQIPPWLARARKDLGQRETLGPNDSPRIRAMLKKLRLEWLAGQPWCGTMLGEWMLDCGIQPPANFFRAKAWLDWGTILHKPVLGCVAVFSRVGGGHVGLVDAMTADGRVMIHGANQGDMVNSIPFQISRVSGWRYPPGLPVPTDTLGTVVTSAPSSRTEA